MEKQRLTYLLQQYQAGKATPPEEQELAAFIKSDAGQELFSTVMTGLMQQQTPIMPGNTAYWQKMVQHIVRIDKSVARPATAPIRMLLPIYRWAAAAAVLMLVTAGVYFFSTAVTQVTIGSSSLLSWPWRLLTKTYSPSTMDRRYSWMR